MEKRTLEEKTVEEKTVEEKTVEEKTVEEKTVEEKRTIDAKQAVQLLWNEWKYRHDLFWRSLFRWAGSIITLWIIPFLKPDVFRAFPAAVWLFPSLAFFLSLFSAWLLGAEQGRFRMVNIKYKELRGNYCAGQMPMKTPLDRLFAAPIATVVVVSYGLAFAFASIVVGFLLWRFIGHLGTLTDGV